MKVKQLLILLECMANLLAYGFYTPNNQNKILDLIKRFNPEAQLEI